VRFEQRLQDGIHSGAIVVAFRRWKRSQVVPGRRYRTGIDVVEVESVDVVGRHRWTPPRHARPGT
jgi:hypothetical protein